MKKDGSYLPDSPPTHSSRTRATKHKRAATEAADNGSWGIRAGQMAARDVRQPSGGPRMADISSTRATVSDQMACGAVPIGTATMGSRMKAPSCKGGGAAAKAAAHTQGLAKP